MPTQPTPIVIMQQSPDAQRALDLAEQKRLLDEARARHTDMQTATKAAQHNLERHQAKVDAQQKLAQTLKEQQAAEIPAVDPLEAAQKAHDAAKAAEEEHQKHVDELSASVDALLMPATAQKPASVIE